MVAIARSSASTRIQQILLTTAHHFEIRALPDPQLALPYGEFRDPLRFRTSETSRLPVRHQLVVSCSALSTTMSPA
jgi:hypothetical protein